VPWVFIGIGSNINREEMIRSAVRELDQRYGPLTLSPVYESQAVGFSGDNFFNLVVGFETLESITGLKSALMQMERLFGRQPDQRAGSRTLDLDLLLYGDTVQQEAEAVLPHPDILRYDFVLRPLADIAPNRLHPKSKQTFADLWRERKPNSQTLKTVTFPLT